MHFGTCSCLCQRCCARSDHWLGSTVGLNGFTLKYSNPDDEAGFVRHCSDKLNRNLFYAAVMGAAFTGMYFLVDVTSAYIHVPVQRIITSVDGGICLMCLSFAIILKSPRLIAHISFDAREAIAVFIASTYLASMVFASQYYLSKALGQDPRASFDHPPGRSDGWTLSQIYVCIICFQIIPARWLCMLITDIVGLLVYLICCSILGSEDSYSWYNWGALLTGIFFALLATRQHEYSERLMFSSFLAEKTLRYQAEFQISQLEEMSHRSDEEIGHDVQSEQGSQNSLPYTTFTGNDFISFGNDGLIEPKLARLVDIGLQEKWLRRAIDVRLVADSVLSCGGFGVVAVALLHDTPVAIKLPLPSQRRSRSRRCLAQFANELRILRQVTHPNIVGFMGACVDPENGDTAPIALLLELAPGVQLNIFMARCPEGPDPSSRFQVLLGVSRALNYLYNHKPSLVHGDIKPANIMVATCDSVAHPKLLDFGLSRLITRHARPLGGTRSWMAPELLHDVRVPPKACADVFSFGVLTYFVLTGRQAFEGPHNTLRSIQIARRRPLLWPGCISSLEKLGKGLVDECLAKAPNARPDMQEVNRNLDSWPSLCNLEGSEVNLVAPLHTRAASMAFQSGVAHIYSMLKKKKPATEAVEDRGTRHSASEPASQQGAVPHGALVHSRFKQTPRQIQALGAFDLILSWNCQMRPTSCCAYHAQVQQLEDICASLAARACTRVDYLDGDLIQCPQCLLILSFPTQADTIDCETCGYQGAPARRSDAGGAVDRRHVSL